MDNKLFPDVDYTKWYGPFIKIATESGLMIGDDQGNFRPDEPLTRAEAAVIVSRIIRLVKNGSAADLLNEDGGKILTGSIGADQISANIDIFQRYDT